MTLMEISTDTLPMERAIVSEANPEIFSATPGQRDTVLIVGAAGANARHMDGAVRRLVAEHPVHGVDLRIPDDPEFPIPRENMHIVGTPEANGDQEVLELIKSGVVRAVYLSLVPSMHVQEIVKYLCHVGEGLIDFLVVPKPAVSNLEERREVEIALREARARLRARTAGEAALRSERSLLYVHEHYQRKEAWDTLRQHLGEVSKHLGRLESVTIGIEEAATAEGEGRVKAFERGAMDDLGPHTMSMALDVAHSLNTDRAYTVSSRPHATTVQRYRYADSELPEGVETAFTVHGTTTITDHQRDGETHNVDFTMRGGKGLINKKEATLTFIHPDTGKRSIVAVNLRTNELFVPDEVSSLFPPTTFSDNGYGKIVLDGLNGGDPDISFQHWSQARVVTKWGVDLAELGQGQLVIHERGLSLDELAAATNLIAA